MAEAERRKDEFIAVLAHELRNPLSAIGMAAHLLQATDSEEERSWGLGIVGHQVKTLNRLIEDLLDVSRISNGKIHLRKEAVDLASVIARAVESVTALIKEREHELTVSVPREPMVVEGDPTRLEQVFGNLLTNAAKYTEKGAASRSTRGSRAGISSSACGIPARGSPRRCSLGCSRCSRRSNRPRTAPGAGSASACPSSGPSSRCTGGAWRWRARASGWGANSASGCLPGSVSRGTRRIPPACRRA